MHAIRLSICIPTYNFGRFIGETLKSVIDQATDEVEIVVLDSGSTDNTADVVRGFQSHFPRLAYHRRGQKGGIDKDLAATVDLAQGEYCWLLSSDDVLMPGAIRHILREIEAGHSVYLCNRVECDSELTPLRTRQWLADGGKDHIFAFRDPPDLVNYFNRSLSLGALFSYMSSIIVQREKWSETAFREDLSHTNYAHVERLFSLLRREGTLKYIGEPLLFCRGYNDSFRKDGIARRFMIDLDGYMLLADDLFQDAAVRRSFLDVLRREYKWYVLLELRSNLSDRRQWAPIREKLRHYGYTGRELLLINVLGSVKPLIQFARLTINVLRGAQFLWARTLRRIRGSCAPRVDGRK